MVASSLLTIQWTSDFRGIEWLPKLSDAGWARTGMSDPGAHARGLFFGVI